MRFLFYSCYIIILICVATAFSNECIPLCRSGYFCYEGECKDFCNPPCGSGKICDTVTHNCIPSSQNDKIIKLDCDSGCESQEICINGACKSKERVATIGNVRHAFSSSFYTLGTISYLTASITFTMSAVFGPESGIHFAGAAQEFGGAVLSSAFWGLRQLPLHAQKQTLIDLGVNVESIPYRKAAILHWSTVCLGGATFILGLSGGFSENNGVNTTAIVFSYGTSVLSIISYINNMKIYSNQKRLLNKSVSTSGNLNFDLNNLHPYLSYYNNKFSFGANLEF